MMREWPTLPRIGICRDGSGNPSLWQGMIDSVKINPSLLRMRECTFLANHRYDASIALFRGSGIWRGGSRHVPWLVRALLNLPLWQLQIYTFAHTVVRAFLGTLLLTGFCHCWTYHESITNRDRSFVFILLIFRRSGLGSCFSKPDWPLEMLMCRSINWQFPSIHSIHWLAPMLTTLHCAQAANSFAGNFWNSCD